MLDGLPLRLTVAAGIGFGAIGIAMFVAPGWAADEFAWPVSPFLAMTMGAWYIGTAAFALECARVRRWSAVRGAAVFLWLFVVFQACVLAVHGSDLELGGGLGAVYMGVVVLGIAATVAGVIQFVHVRAFRDVGGPAVSPWLRAFVFAFALAVALLALPLLDGYDNPASIWPGELGLASARSFAAFFGALSLSSLLVALGRRLEPIVVYARAGIVLDVVILVAALVYFDRFDFGDHPGQLLYVGLYVLVAAVAVGIVATAGRSEAAPAAQSSLH